MVDERDKGDKLWELLSKLHENPPKADHGKTVRTYVHIYIKSSLNMKDTL